MRRLGPVLLLATMTTAAIALVLSPQSRWRRAEAWQGLASPGPLSAAHASLRGECAACHTGDIALDAVQCIACHANDSALLQRLPTAFHADIRTCRDCHIEHQARELPPTRMDHGALAKIGLRQLDDSGQRDARALLLGWIEDEREHEEAMDGTGLGAEEAALRCSACHASDDRHLRLFGEDCAACHGTSAWTIVGFEHPSPRSFDCAQCHQAPPSHFMEHFAMVSARVAGEPNARVGQCYACHQTTAWPDIKRVGWYKHH